MTRRILVEKTLKFESPKRIPRQIWILPWARKQHPEYVKRLQERFPDDIVQAPICYKEPPEVSGDKYTPGNYTDEWGCVFRNLHDGIMGVVQEPLIRRLEDAGNFKPPESVIHLDREEIADFCSTTDQFVLAGNFQRPFERFQFLRTMELALLDLEMEAEGLTDPFALRPLPPVSSGLHGIGFHCERTGSVFNDPEDVPGAYLRFQEEWEVFMRELSSTDLVKKVREWGYNLHMI